jgi:uroporphyrinogen-III decarboxylase
MLSAPPLRNALKALLDLADAGEAHNAALGAHVGEMAALGYPYGYMAVTSPAFDVVSDFFRGLRGGSIDIYRNPDRLLATVELMQPSVIGLSVAVAKMTGNPRVFIPMHRGADGFMSEEAFERLYWPTFRALIEALIAAGLTPMPLFEGNYTSRLKYLAELPAGKIAAHFDHIDRKKFKEICGGVMCFWGNVPASLLCTGTPRQVKDDVKELIDLFGDTGALIIDGNQGIPDEARPENVMALREAADEYGSY